MPRNCREDFLPKKSTALVAPVQQFFDAVGREKMMEALTLSPKKHHKDLLQALRENKDFPKACQKAEVSHTDLVDLYADYNVQLGRIRAAEHLPQVMEDVAIDAKSRMEMCPRCDGNGWVVKDEDRTTCPLCKGGLEIRVSGDDKARALLFEQQGLTGKKVPAVVLQQNFNSRSLDETVGFTQKLLTGK